MHLAWADLRHFGPIRLDAITTREVHSYWEHHVEGAGRKPSAGKNDIDAIAAVLGCAQIRGHIEVNPVDAYRQVRARKNWTQRGRAATDKTRFINPIEDPGDLAKLVAAARDESLTACVRVLLCLEARLRDGEALGLRWGDIALGECEGDPRRVLLIEEARSRRGKEGPTKSGRGRPARAAHRLCAGRSSEAASAIRRTTSFSSGAELAHRSMPRAFAAASGIRS